MAEPTLDGRRVVLMGRAEEELIEATVAAFAGVGANVDRLADDEGGPVGRLDVGICFARSQAGAALADLDESAAHGALETALRAPLRAALGAAHLMATGDGGSLVIVGTLDLNHAYAGRAVASVAMGGLLGLVRAMAVELSPREVRSNLVVAGPLAVAGALADQDRTRVERTLLRSPMHRLGSPEEVAAAIRFVAGPEAGFMTGQTLRVDGGWASLNQAPEGMRFA